MSFAAIGVGVGASVAGAAASAALKPKAPKAAAFTSVDLQDEQRKAIKGNMDQLPNVEALGRGVNIFNQEEMDRMYEASLPGYNRIKGRIGSNIESLVGGNIPADVANRIRSSAAARSVYGGYGGSGMAHNLEARDLGLTSLDLMTKGMDSASRWLATSRAPTFDITSMFVRPPAIDPQAERNTQVRYANDANRYNFQNDPWNQFQSEMSDVFGSSLKSFLGGTNFGGNGSGGGFGSSWDPAGELNV